ncbi:hypothetical protein BJ508DRAFT_350908 [Ascobolus immersus RN42]|uniref:Cora-domain-containing protein n=1 Tax=Ascobolus immersus RN42 TaxID=1160509 RepID=A0A3N4HUU6_ASCIM|nr:hypothetical protein BJ508DRAFT_350908 [Ascobolus immersus RN42]
MEEIGWDALKRQMTTKGQIRQDIVLQAGNTALESAQFDRYRILVSSSGDTTVPDWCTPFELNSTMPFDSDTGQSAASKSGVVTANMELIYIPLDYFGLCKSNVDLGKMEEMFRRSQIEPYFLSLRMGHGNIQQGLYPDGFHWTKRTNIQTGYPCYSFLYATLLNPFVVAWSFEPHTCTTRAIMYDPFRIAGHIFLEKLQQLQRFIHSPYVLGACLSFHWIFSNQHTPDITDVITESEVVTGHKVNTDYANDSNAEQNAGIDAKLIEVSTKVTMTAEMTQGRLNEMYSLDTLYDHILSEKNPFATPEALALQLTGIGTSHSRSSKQADVDVQFDGRIFSSTESLIEVVRMAKAQAGGSVFFLKWFLSRARAQQSVIFNVLTHHDAQVNLSLAEAMREDSISMKTVAIMTMAFLPATFFAAVFAIPTLKWEENQDSVVQDGFWIYLGISIAATALVFIVWDLNTKSGLKRAVKKIIEKNARDSVQAEAVTRQGWQVQSAKSSGFEDRYQKMKEKLRRVVVQAHAVGPSSNSEDLAVP